MIRLLVSLSLAISAFAAPVANPTYEVKFSLLNSALDSGAPSADLSDAFGLGSSSKTRSYSYFDTNAKDLNAKGYKKRYPVDSNLDAVLALAKDEGFDSSDTNYKAEVDWSYAKQTLSFSNDKKASSSSLSGTALPAEADGRSLLVSNIPGKLEDWKSKNWGKDTLNNARQYGPVTSKTYDGTWEGVDVGVEVLTIKTADGSGTELYTEFSFKIATEDEAQTLRSKAQQTLEGNGWLDKDGDLKTSLVLDRY